MYFPVIQTLWLFTWRLSLNHSIKLWKDIPLKLIVQRFQKLRHVQFSYVDSDLGNWCIIWNGGINLKNTVCTMPPVGGLKSSCGGTLRGEPQYQRERGSFYGGADLSTILSELRTYVSLFWRSLICITYLTFFLVKTS